MKYDLDRKILLWDGKEIAETETMGNLTLSLIGMGEIDNPSANPKDILSRFLKGLAIQKKEEGCDKFSSELVTWLKKAVISYTAKNPNIAGRAWAGLISGQYIAWLEGEDYALNSADKENKDPEANA